MKRNILIGIIVALLVSGGAVGAYFIFKSDSNELSESSESSEASNEESSAIFNPLPTVGVAFVATVNGTTSDGDIYTAVIRHDAKGNTHYEGSYGDSEIDMYQINGKNIICSNGTCIVTPTVESTPITSDQYEYNEEDYNELKNIAEYAGRENCKSGTCDVWQINEANSTGKLFIDSGGRVDRAEWTSPDGSFSIDYEYQDVQIKEPDNVQNLVG